MSKKIIKHSPARRGTDQPVQYLLGQHDAKIATLQLSSSRIEKKVDDVLEIVSQAKGGWKVMVFLGSILGVIAGAIGAGVHSVFVR